MEIWCHWVASALYCPDQQCTYPLVFYVMREKMLVTSPDVIK